MQAGARHSSVEQENGALRGEAFDRLGSMPRKTPRTRTIEATAAQWACDATPRGQDIKAYLVQEVIPTLLPALIKLIHQAEDRSGEIQTIDPSLPFDEQSRSYTVFLARKVVPLLNQCLQDVAASRPHDPIDELARLLFERSGDVEYTNSARDQGRTDPAADDEDDEWNPVHLLAQFLFRNNPRHHKVQFTPRFYRDPGAAQRPNPREATPRRREMPKTYPPAAEPKVQMVARTPRHTSDGPDKGSTVLELLGEHEKRIEVLLQPKMWKLQARRDPVSMVYSFVAECVDTKRNEDDQETGATGGGSASEAKDPAPAVPKESGFGGMGARKRVERVMDETEVTALLMSSDRWKTSMSLAAQDLLKRATLFPTRGKSVGRNLTLSFEGCPDVPKDFTYFKGSRRINGVLHILEVIAEKHKGMQSAVLPEAPPKAVNKKREQPATTPAGSPAVVLRVRVYEPQNSRWLEAAAPLVLSTTVVGRQRQVEEALQRVDIVDTGSKGMAACFRLTPCTPPEEGSCRVVHLPVRHSTPSDGGADPEPKKKGKQSKRSEKARESTEKAAVVITLGFTSSDAGPNSSGRPLLMVLGTLMDAPASQPQLLLLIPVGDGLKLPPVGGQHEHPLVYWNTYSTPSSKNTVFRITAVESSGEKDMSGAVNLTWPKDILSRLYLERAEHRDELVLRLDGQAGADSATKTSCLSRRVMSARAMDAAVAAIFEPTTGSVITPSTAVAAKPEEMQAREELWRVRRDQAFRKRREPAPLKESTPDMATRNSRSSKPKDARAEAKPSLATMVADMSADMQDFKVEHGEFDGDFGGDSSGARRRSRRKAPETGAPQWTDQDGALVFRRVQYLSGKRMIVSVVLLRRARNGSVRLEAHDPESCLNVSTVVDHYDTTDLPQPSGEGEAVPTKMDAGAAKRLCGRLRIERGDWGRGELALAVWEDDDLATKMRKCFLGLDQNSKGHVKVDDIIQALGLARRDLQILGSLGRGAKDERPDFARTSGRAVRYLAEVIHAVERTTGYYISFADFLDAMDRACPPTARELPSNHKTTTVQSRSSGDSSSGSTPGGLLQHRPTRLAGAIEEAK